MAHAPVVKGVNLGGWLLLESWMNEQMFQGTDARDEFTLCMALGSDAEKIMEEHRCSWITKQDFVDIKNAGLDSVRLPFGYWVLDIDGLPRKPSGPYTGNRAWMEAAPCYIGPCEQHLQNALDWALENGLSVNLCLHGAPGGQSGHDACGFSDSHWHPSMWDKELTITCLAHVARRFGHHPALYAITVVNEPSPQIAGGDLACFYCDAYEAIRNAPCEATVVMPVYQRTWWWLQTWHRFPPTHFRNVAFDTHQYHCFGAIWQMLSLYRTLVCARTGFLHTPSLGTIMDTGNPGMVSEWSLRLPAWDSRWLIAKELESFSEKDRDSKYAEFARRQQEQYQSARAWYFWTWKVDAASRNEGVGEPWWDMRECIRRGWISLV